MKNQKIVDVLRNGLPAKKDKVEMFELAKEIDSVCVDGASLLGEWLEMSNEATLSNIADVAVAGVSLIQYKQSLQKYDGLPEVLKMVMMAKDATSVDAKVAKESTMAWVAGFMAGIMFYKQNMGGQAEDES